MISRRCFPTFFTPLEEDFWSDQSFVGEKPQENQQKGYYWFYLLGTMLVTSFALVTFFPSHYRQRGSYGRVPCWRSGQCEFAEQRNGVRDHAGKIGLSQDSCSIWQGFSLNLANRVSWSSQTGFWTVGIQLGGKPGIPSVTFHAGLDVTSQLSWLCERKRCRWIMCLSTCTMTWMKPPSWVEAQCPPSRIMWLSSILIPLWEWLDN